MSARPRTDAGEAGTAAWRAVARSQDISRPHRVMLDGLPIVLFRGAEGLAALHDRCPHRAVPLSGGEVVEGAIECPYHGWRFSGSGACVAVPGHLGEVPRIRAHALKAIEREGLVYVTPSGTQPLPEPYAHVMAGTDAVTRLLVSRTRGTLLDVAENILDATHTHYTHKGLLRGLSTRRQRVRVEVRGTSDTVEAVYTGEEKQDGLVSRLLEGARSRTVGRFRAPGIAELEFWGPKGIALATTFHLRQSTPDGVDGVAVLAGPRERGLGTLKAMAMVPLFHVALRQDQRVLARAHENARLFPDRGPAIGPLDILRAEIAAILAGREPPAATRPRVMEIEL